MASAFAHALSSYAFGKTFPISRISTKVLCIGAFSAILPDIDVLAFTYGIDYMHMFGHRGITHSISFAVLWAFLMIIIFHRCQSGNFYRGLYYFICTASHGLLDAMTTGGRGVAFFAPFSAERYFLPWRFIHVSPLGVGNFFSEWGVRVIQNEIIYIGFPCIILIVLGYFLNKYFYTQK